LIPLKIRLSLRGALSPRWSGPLHTNHCEEETEEKAFLRKSGHHLSHHGSAPATYVGEKQLPTANHPAMDKAMMELANLK
jgi:hypothetical protein